MWNTHISQMHKYTNTNDDEMVDLGMAREFENAKHPEHSEGDKGPRHLDENVEELWFRGLWGLGWAG